MGRPQVSATIGQVAQLYYEHGLTHQEIATLTGFSRVKVTRLLAEARATGLVEIRVHSDEELFVELSQALKDRWGLAATWLAPSIDHETAGASAISRIGAQAVRHVLDDRGVRSIAVCLSRTGGEVLRAVSLPESRPELRVYPVTGTPGGSALPVSSLQLTIDFARAIGAMANHIAAPLMASSSSMATVLRSDPGVGDVLAEAARADLLITGVGVAAGIPEFDILDRGRRDAATARGAVADFCTHFVDAEGRLVETPTDDQVIALTWDEVRSIPIRFIVANGPAKVEPLRAALAGGLITHLVTDDATALTLLE